MFAHGEISESPNHQPGRGPVQRRDMLGGLLHDSFRDAAERLVEPGMGFSPISAIRFSEREQEERGESLNFTFEAGRHSQPSVNERNASSPLVRLVLNR
jgi:hypothetical protein